MMQSREEILKQWPNARWFPGDVPPVDQHVYRVNCDSTIDKSEQGRVLEVVTRETIPESHCLTCTCQRTNSIFGWWRVEWPRQRGRWVGSTFVRDDSGDVYLVTAEYPPRLAPAEETL